METLLLGLGWGGLFAPLALGAIGSILGCSIAGQAAIGAMLEVDSGQGRLIGISAMPSSQTIYGIVVMFSLSQEITVNNALAFCIVGFLTGFALLYSALRQGYCCAAAVQVAKAKPESFGISLAPAAIVEGFAVFAFVFALVIIGNIPK